VYSLYKIYRLFHFAAHMCNTYFTSSYLTGYTASKNPHPSSLCTSIAAPIIL
jgi:hypothetical protein